MKRYYIEEVKCGITDGGMACGLVSGSVITGIKFNDGEHKTSEWLWNDQYMNYPYIMLTDKDIFDDLMSEYDDSDPFFEYRENHLISEYDGIDFDGELDDVCQSVIEHSKKKSSKLLKLLLYVSNSEVAEEELETFKGKYLDEIDLDNVDLSDL